MREFNLFMVNIVFGLACFLFMLYIEHSTFGVSRYHLFESCQVCGKLKERKIVEHNLNMVM